MTLLPCFPAAWTAFWPHGSSRSKGWPSSACTLSPLFLASPKAFRIGGDEFVVIAVGMEEEEFFRKLKTVYAKMKEKEVSISAGFVWKEETMDLEALTKTADHQMYKEKEKYHRENRYEPG